MTHMENALIDREHVVLSVRDLKKYYPTGPGGLFGKPKKLLRALDGVSFDVCRGEIIGIVGESGCGKSTLGRCALRLIDVTDGTVVFEGRDITHLSSSALKPIRRDMQMIFQNPFSSFNPKQSIGSALREVGHVHGIKSAEADEKIRALLADISLPEDILSRSPGELSGGQLQRLAIARALLLDPKFIVADEAVSALDVSVQAQILNLIVDLRRKLSMTMMFISHEMTVVEHTCDTIAVMYLGRIVEIAPTRELFGNVLHPYTQALLSAIPKSDPDDDKQRIILQGDVQSAIDLPKGCRFASRCSRCTAKCLESEPELRDFGNGHRAACHLV
jgi:oligopeptide/dipeptide ABC transporter ATP-binding protein